MVETALEVTDHRVPGTVISEILAAGRELLTYPIETLPYVDQALGQLQETHRLILVTKGDIFDQERKLAASGLADYFAAIEIVADKDPATYTRIFERHTEGPEHTVMVGNSLRQHCPLPAGALPCTCRMTDMVLRTRRTVRRTSLCKDPHLGELASHRYLERSR